MDVDMIARADIAQLWVQTIPDGKALLAKDETHTCVMLFDCERMKRVLPPFDALRRTEGMYRNVRRAVGSVSARFDGNWNCLDGESYPTLMDPEIKVIHFTRVETQPHFKWALPRLHMQGKRHWSEHSGKPVGLPHARKDVAPLIDNVFSSAVQAGYTPDKYAPAQPFGSYDAVRGGARAA